MTRKTSNRLKRVAVEKEAAEVLKKNTCWDDLHTIHGDCLVLMSKHLIIAGYLRNKALNNFLIEPGRVASNAKLLAKDSAVLKGDLEDLLKLIGGRTGGSSDPDEVMESFVIYEKFQLWMQRHEAVLVPTIDAILEQYAIAEATMNAAVDEGKAILEGTSDGNAIAEGDFEQLDNAKPAVLRGAATGVLQLDDATFHNTTDAQQ